jgi:integrase
MKLEQRDGKWHVRFKDANGKRQRLATGVESSVPVKVAEKAAAGRIREYLMAQQAAPVVSRRAGTLYNLGEALERTYVSRWRGTKSDIQLKYVVRRLEREIGHWLLKEIDYQRLREQRDSWKNSGIAPATVNRRFSIISVTLSEAHKEGDLPAMPAMPEKLAENNIRERYMTADEEQRAREYLRKRVAIEQIEGVASEWLYMTALFDFLLDTGCRLSEALVHLTRERFDGRAVRFPAGVTKTAPARSVPLTPRARAAAEVLLEYPAHGTLTDDWAGHRWMLVREACGFPDLNLHILRHTCASRLLKRGVALYTVSKWLGHASIRTTQRYAHLEEGTLEQAAAALAAVPMPVANDADGYAGTHPLRNRT